MNFEDLFPFCETERQREILTVRVRHSSHRSAAAELGIAEVNVRRPINAMIRRASTGKPESGWTPVEVTEHLDADGNLTGKSVRSGPDSWTEQGGLDAGPARDGTGPYIVKGVSTYYNANGEQRGQWVKTKLADIQREEMMRAFAEELSRDIPALPPISAPDYHDDRLLTLLPLGDPHFGMLAWHEECGANFDLETAERLTFDAVDRICARTPSSKVAVLLNLGDFFHADNGSNRTPQSGNQLDVDGRFEKIARVGFRAVERVIIRMLEKHETVIVRNNRGNHDPHQAAMLSIALGGRFHDNPRVVVDANPSSFWYYRWGKTLIGSTHGDGAKLNDLPLIMAADAKEDWAASEWRVWHCGHFHHDQVKDLVGCRVETHRTLAGTDAWHRHQGYRSHRDLKAIVYDIEYGEVARLRCGVEELTT